LSIWSQHLPYWSQFETSRDGDLYFSSVFRFSSFGLTRVVFSNSTLYFLFPVLSFDSLYMSLRLPQVLRSHSSNSFQMKYLLTILLLHLAVTYSYSQQVPVYQIAGVFHIRSDGGYDYTTVDTASDRLYVSHGMQVNILNKKSGDSLGVIQSDKDVHGIALVHALGKGYISNGGNNSVLVFDLNTNKVLGHVPTGKFADGIFYDPYSNKIITCNGMSKNMTIIDPVADTVFATVQLTGWPEAAVSDGAGKIYVNNAEKSEIDVIDTRSFKILKQWPLAPGKGPSGLAIDRQTMRLFAGCENKLLVVMNAVNGKMVTSLPIGAECDAVGFDANLKTVYSSNGEGTLTIINERSADQFTVSQNLATKRGARTLAVDQLTHTIYLPFGEFGPKKPGAFRPSVLPGTFQVLVVKVAG
jgi:DNA-binding beta-propeller fold protein YncE